MVVPFVYTEEEYKKLEEEIKKLKSDLSLVIKERDDNIKQNKKLREVNSYRAKVVDIIPQDEKSVSEETIQDLQEKIRFLEQCLDNKEKVNISLREENKRLEKEIAEYLDAIRNINH